jgi:hypothetical protein
LSEDTHGGYGVWRARAPGADFEAEPWRATVIGSRSAREASRVVQQGPQRAIERRTA